MARSRFNQEQKIAAVQTVKAGTSVTDVCCQYRISNATYYAWRRKFANLAPTLDPANGPSASPSVQASETCALPTSRIGASNKS